MDNPTEPKRGVFMDAKTTGIVAYITWIGLVIAFVLGDREGAKFHLNQALVIWLAGLLSFIPCIGWLWGNFLLHLRGDGLHLRCQWRGEGSSSAGTDPVAEVKEKGGGGPRAARPFLLFTGRKFYAERFYDRPGGLSDRLDHPGGSGVAISAMALCAGGHPLSAAAGSGSTGMSTARAAEGHGR